MEACKLKDYGGNYELFLEKNKKEADKMAEKQGRQKELQKSQIKSKSKVGRSSKACLPLLIRLYGLKSNKTFNFPMWPELFIDNVELFIDDADWYHKSWGFQGLSVCAKDFGSMPVNFLFSCG